MKGTILNINTRTFWYREETNDNESIAMSASHIVVHIANQGIQGVIFVITHAHRYGGLSSE
jgi:hypothetical protein